MAKANVNDQRQPLPEKIERRLAELVQMGEFLQGDVEHCRTSYWTARNDWHKILIDCYDAALARQRTAGAVPAATPPPMTSRPAPAVRAARPMVQGVLA